MKGLGLASLLPTMTSAAEKWQAPPWRQLSRVFLITKIKWDTILFKVPQSAKTFLLLQRRVTQEQREAKVEYLSKKGPPSQKEPSRGGGGTCVSPLTVPPAEEAQGGWLPMFYPKEWQ